MANFPTPEKFHENLLRSYLLYLHKTGALSVPPEDLKVSVKKHAKKGRKK